MAKCSISATYEADTQQKLDVASKRLAMGNLPGMGAQMFLDAGGGIFQPGASSGSRGAHLSAHNKPIDDEQPLRNTSEFRNSALAIEDTVLEKDERASEDELAKPRRTRHEALTHLHL
eukprot:5382915-Heterocapsa_arctica.AAC.1